MNIDLTVLQNLSTWLAIIVYSAGVALFVMVIGIAVGNWQVRHNIRSLFSAAAATFAALYVLALAAIASNWFPAFSGVYVALGLRVTFGLAIANAYVTLILYLRARWHGAPC